MTRTAVLAAALMACGWALPTAAQDDGAYVVETGTAKQLLETSRARAADVKVVYVQPLTSSRVNTASTRAVDVRRAAAAGTRVPQRNRAHVVTNPLAAKRATPARSYPGQSPSVLRPVAGPSTQPVTVVRFVDERPDPIYDQRGAVRAQPPVARAQDPIEPANHRAAPPVRRGGTHVTNTTSTSYSKPPSAVGYDASRYADYYPSPAYYHPSYGAGVYGPPYYVTYPNGYSFYSSHVFPRHGWYGPSYYRGGYHHYHGGSSFRVKFGYHSGSTSVKVGVGR